METQLELRAWSWWRRSAGAGLPLPAEAAEQPGRRGCWGALGKKEDGRTGHEGLESKPAYLPTYLGP